MADEYPPILDAAMVADLLGMNIDTVRRLSREGVIPSHRVPGGRTYKYLKDEVIEWLRAQPAHNPSEAEETAEDAAGRTAEDGSEETAEDESERRK